MANLTNSAKLINEMEKKVNSTSLAAVATSWAYGDLTWRPGNATANTPWLIKLWSSTAQTTAANDPSSTANRTYPVQVDADWKAVVNVPWSDTTTWSATSSTAGTIKLGSDTEQSIAAEAVSATSNRSYALQVNASGQWVVNVPWENTTYSEVSKSDMDTGTATTAGVVAAKSIADYVSWMISGVYKFKWTKATYDELPTTGRKNWDVWNIETAHTTAPIFPAWANVAWDWSSWDVLWWVVDLSGYVDLSSAQTITWVKTFWTSPVMPAKSSAPSSSNTTVVATEAQVAGMVDNAAYWSTWDWVSWVAPSKDAVYDKISAMDTTIGNKANSSDVITKTNTTAFTPTGDYNPATKKYVDDVAASINSAEWWNITGTLADQTDLKTALDAKVGSSNNTINNVVHLTQSAYDALTTKDENTWYSTPDDWSGGFDPENAWTTGQVLKKTATWYNWANESWAVTSVNTKTWAVTLATDDISDANQTNKYVTAADKTAWNNKVSFAPASAWSTGNVLTKTAGGYDWSAPADQLVYCTQDEYDDLPSSKLTDGINYVIIESNE